jgi:hypothetical protein
MCTNLKCTKSDTLYMAFCSVFMPANTKKWLNSKMCIAIQVDSLPTSRLRSVVLSKRNAPVIMSITASTTKPSKQNEH